MISFAAVAAALVSLASCTETEANYTFSTVYTTNVSDTTLMAPVKAFILSYKYFQTQPSYYATYTDACNQAYADFAQACYDIDDEELCALIPAEGSDGQKGSVILYLLSSNSGEIVAYSQTWTSTAEVDDEEDDDEN